MTEPTINEAATAFMLVAASMVLLMTPGLALFYGGMTRAKSVLNMIMMSFGAMAVVGVIYVLWGYSMAFGNLQDGTSDIAGVFTNPFHLFGLKNVIGDDGSRLIDVFGVDVFIPETVFVGFHLTFAVITAVLLLLATSATAAAASGTSCRACSAPCRATSSSPSCMTAPA